MSERKINIICLSICFIIVLWRMTIGFLYPTASVTIFLELGEAKEILLIASLITNLLLIIYFFFH